jgi:hypothetical protein
LVVRAGGGIYYTNGLLSDQSQPIYNEVQNFYLSSASGSGLSYPISSYLGSVKGIASADGMDRRRKDAYATEWSLSLQAILPAELLATATYFGAQGTHLLSNTSVNLIDPQTNARPFPAFGQIAYRGNTGSSTQNSLALLAQRDLRDGLQLTAGYAWSHEIDDGASGAGEADAPENPACQRCERSSGDGDVRHKLGLYSLYVIPYGRTRAHRMQPSWLSAVAGDWDLIDSFTARSALPVNVTMDRSASKVATGYTVRQRPDRVPGVSLRPPNGPSQQEWLNPAAFTTPHGLYGDAGRNGARGPAAWQLNTGLRRSFALPHKIQLQVWANMQNILNHAQYGQPLSDWSTSQFGEIVSPSNTSRIGQGGSRALFVSFDAYY